MYHKICDTMEIRFIYDRRKIATDIKPSPVELEIYFNRSQRKIITTKVTLLPHEWDGYVVNRVDATQLNKYLHNIKCKYEDVIHSMNVDGIEITKDNFEETINPDKVKRPTDFMSFMYEEIFKNRIRDTTRTQHLIAFSALQRFGKIKSFQSLTPLAIQKLDDFLRKENPKRCQTTIYGYHKRIKPYVIKAYKLGYIESNPYNRFNDVRGSYKDRQPLTQQELDNLQTIKLTPVLDKIRDLFIFQCYTGIAYADLESFNYKKEVVESNGMKFIDGHRYKTGTAFYTPILPPAMKVLEKYNYKIPVITNQRYNSYLHLIELAMGLNKPLTSHIARHTFATTVALTHNVPIEIVSKMLGHKDIKTTQIYAKVLKTTVEKSVIEKMI